MVRVGCEVPSEAKRVYDRCHLAFVELATVQLLTMPASLSPVEANKVGIFVQLRPLDSHLRID